MAFRAFKSSLWHSVLLNGHLDQTTLLNATTKIHEKIRFYVSKHKKGLTWRDVLKKVVWLNDHQILVTTCQLIERVK